MITRLLPIFGLASLLMLGACSTSKLVQTDVNDDVYYSVAQAKEAVPIVYAEKNYVTEREVYADESSNSGYYDDYSVRINRFHRYSPWRSYYDSYYDPYYSPYSYNRYNSPGLRVNVMIGGGYGYGYNPYFNDPYYYGYYGSPYRPNYWGMQSYYNTYPYYGGNYGSGSYYGGMGRDIQSSPNYRPRPGRDFENMPNSSGRRTTPSETNGVKDNSGVITDTRSRTERYNDGNRVITPSTSGSTQTRTTSSRPTRTESERPTTTSSAPQRSTDSSRSTIESRPTRVESNYPAPSSSQPSSSGSSSSGSGSGSTSSGRPSRGN